MIYPASNDTEHSLWLKIASGLYDYAIASSVSDLTPPSFNDNIEALQKKAAYYTARVVDAS